MTSAPDPLNDLDARIGSAKRESTVLPPPPPEPGTEDSGADQRLAARAGSELIGGILGGGLLGYCADLTFDTRPAGIAIGLVLGVVAGFYGLWRLLRRA